MFSLLLVFVIDSFTFILLSDTFILGNRTHDLPHNTLSTQTGSESFPSVAFSLNITLLQSKISTFPGGLIYVKSPTSPMAVLKRLRMETVLVQPSAAPESPVRLLSTGKSHSPKPSASPWGSLGRKTRLLKISALNPLPVRSQ